MKNPFENVPLNTKKIYVRAITPGGCKIYMPVDTRNIHLQQQIKEELQVYLNLQFPSEPLIVA